MVLIDDCFSCHPDDTVNTSENMRLSGVLGLGQKETRNPKDDANKGEDGPNPKVRERRRGRDSSILTGDPQMRCAGQRSLTSKNSQSQLGNGGAHDVLFHKSHLL